MGEVVQPIIRVATPLRPFKDHADTISALAIFPDGRRMVTGAIDKTICLWDLKDGIMLDKIENHQGSVNAVVISQDGQLVVSGDANGELIAWKLNGDTLELLMQPIKVHSTEIYSLDFSPDGTTLASGSWDKTAELWCTKTWQVQGNPIVCGGQVNCVRYSPSGEFLAIASTDLIICNPRTKERIATLKIATSPCVFSLTWMPNGAQLLSAGATSDPTIRVWNSSTWTQVGDPWTGHTACIRAITVNRTGTLIASGSDDNHVRLWRPSDGRTFAILKDIQDVYCVIFSPDDTHILNGGRSMVVKEWAIPDGALLESPPNEHVSKALDFDSDVSTTSAPPAASIEQEFIATTEAPLFTRFATPIRAYTDHKDTVNSVAVFPDGYRMATSSFDCSVHLWDLKNGIFLKKLEGHSDWVWAMAVSRDGKLIASGDGSGELIIWDGDTGEALFKPTKGHCSDIRSLDFSPDGMMLATGSSDRTTELWSAKTWQAQGNPINCDGAVYCVRFSPSGQRLAMTDSNEGILIYNPHTRERITNLKTDAFAVMWMPDGSRLLSGGNHSDHTIREWDASTWEQVGDPWTGHCDHINVLLVNPNATFIISGSDDNTMRLWRLSDRRTVAIYKDTYEVYCGVFSTDGKRILNGGRSTMVREWALPEEAIPKGEATSSLRSHLTPSTSTMMVETAEVIPRMATPRRTFKDHQSAIFAIAIYPDGQRMVTTSMDQMLLWNLKDGVVLKKMEGHQGTVETAAISGDGKLIASGDRDGVLIAWHGDTGELLTQPIQVHSGCIRSVDFSPDGTTLASGSWDGTTELWCTKTWQIPGNPINCGGEVNCVQYSPSGEFLAIAGPDILICNSRTSECITTLKTTTSPWAYVLVWAPDGTRLFSGGNRYDPNVREWDTLTWTQIGSHWSGHTDHVYDISVNHTGTLVASGCADGQVRLWRPSDGRTLAIFKDILQVYCLTFSKDGKHILSGGETMVVKEWVVPEDAVPESTTGNQESTVALPTDDSEQQMTDTVQLDLSEDASLEHATSKTLFEHVPEKQVTIECENVLEDQAACKHTPPEDAQDHLATVKVPGSHPQMLTLSTTALNACIVGDLHAAEDVLTREIDGNAENYNSYANRSFIRTRKCDWDRALLDALKSISIRPSLIGYISKGIALCGKMNFQDATEAFDMTFMFTDEDSRIAHLILLIKAIALFNANQHERAMLRVHELITACQNADILACHVVRAYLHVQLGINALKQDEAINHFSAAVKSIAFSSTSVIQSQYDVFVVLFGWDLKSLWRTAHQKWCHALLQAGMITEALKSYRHMMNIADEAMIASCLEWSICFKRDCGALYAASGDAALAESSYDKAIELYSAAIKLDSVADSPFANRSKAKLEKMLWEEALLDAEKVIELNASSYLGYQLKHAALHGTQHYDEAIEAYQIMMSKLDNSPDLWSQELRRKYISLSEAKDRVRKVVDGYLENAPPRLFNTSTGLLCDREAQIKTFTMSSEYKQLLSSIVKHADLTIGCIQDTVATYFRYVMLSHRWSSKEPLLQEVQNRIIHTLDPIDGVVKLQSFCRVVRDAGYGWAWSDTCCIDKNNNIEVQESVNTMFVWYSNSALTIIYLSDISKAGTLARSAWTTRGWTVQEFLAPKIVLFYQQDWTLYLNDHTPNHKKSIMIMQELGHATGIDARALFSFRPGMRGAREKLQWASARITTLQEDMAYSLFGIFGVHLPVIYGEKKQNALGRLLQEIIARSGDISALDWIGQSSEFNSCLPADISSYKALPNTLLSLSEDQIESSIPSLRHVVPVDLASKLHSQLNNLSAPRFANCRLRLPCLAFPVTEVRRSRSCDQKVAYAVKATGLNDLSIFTADKLPIRQTLLLIYPWNRYLLEQCSLVDDAQSVEDYPSSPDKDEGELESAWRVSQFIERVRQPVSSFFGSLIGPVDSESHLRALRLIVRLGQPFRAFLLVQQRGGEYKRIAHDHDIVAQVHDMTSVRKMMDIRVVEIL